MSRITESVIDDATLCATLLPNRISGKLREADPHRLSSDTK